MQNVRRQSHGLSMRNADGEKTGCSRNGAGYETALAQLRTAFGSRASEVIDWAGDNPSMYAIVPGTEALPQAALQYSIHRENVTHLTDLLLRRSNIGAAARPVQETVNWAVEQMGRHLNWDRTRKRSELARLYEQYDWWKKPHPIT
jgi:glycerol-3-phosphate dehydrogenase